MIWAKIQKHKHLHIEGLAAWLFDRYKQFSGWKQRNKEATDSSWTGRDVQQLGIDAGKKNSWELDVIVFATCLVMGHVAMMCSHRLYWEAYLVVFEVDKGILHLLAYRCDSNITCAVVVIWHWDFVYVFHFFLFLFFFFKRNNFTQNKQCSPGFDAVNVAHHQTKCTFTGVYLDSFHPWLIYNFTLCLCLSFHLHLWRVYWVVMT